jgi:ubiquinone/menaquinone biosynthesis C-methylase UbiE
MNPATYGDKIADVYDELYGDAPHAVIETLASLAGAKARGLELGIGTGRLALPLASKGIEVHGIDSSHLMLEKLREKPGGGQIPVTVDDFANVDRVPGGPFSLVYCAFNTFFALLTQEDQLKCFRGVSSVLSREGVFAIEAFVPDLGRFPNPQPALVGSLDGDDVEIEASHHDSVKQRVSSRLVRIKQGKVHVYPIEIRYAWPSELDLMAQLAGMHLASRWSGWDRQPFRADSASHVSLYQRKA